MSALPTDGNHARPLVLLDVDGVLNAVSRDPDETAWQDWRTGAATARGRSWRVLWSPSVVQAVHGWLEVAEVQWLTTWGHEANDTLRDLLGLPELPVAGTDDGGGAPSRTAQAEALADVTPAAPDALTGTWWKLDVARGIVAAQPGRRIAWLDDDLVGRDEARAWMTTATDALCLAPRAQTGLRPDDLEVIGWWLRRG